MQLFSFITTYIIVHHTLQFLHCKVIMACLFLALLVIRLFLHVVYTCYSVFYMHRFGVFDFLWSNSDAHAHECTPVRSRDLLYIMIGRSDGSIAAELARCAVW